MSVSGQAGSPRPTPGREKFDAVSDEAMDHVREMATHRPDLDDLTIVLHPRLCPLCRELAVALGMVESEPPHAS